MYVGSGWGLVSVLCTVSSERGAGEAHVRHLLRTYAVPASASVWAFVMISNSFSRAAASATIFFRPFSLILLRIGVGTIVLLQKEENLHEPVDAKTFGKSAKIRVINPGRGQTRVLSLSPEKIHRDPQTCHNLRNPLTDRP